VSHKEASCVVHHRSGDVERMSAPEIADELDTPGVPTIAGLMPVTSIMTRDVVCARADLPTRQVIDLVVNNYIGCLPVVDEAGQPIGMITKRDLVEPLANRVADKLAWCELSASSAEQLMLPLVFTLDDHATVLQAAAMMALEDLHHVPVVSRKGRLIGVVSSLDIVRWLVKNDGVPSPQQR
jgi:CBS domain-containing protein